MDHQAVMVDCWHLLQRLVRETLCDERLTEAFGEALLARLDRWATATPGKYCVTLLPSLTCQAAGGTSQQALPVLAAWQGLHIAAKLFDDVEDGDAVDPAIDVNIASALLVVVPLLLETLDAVSRSDIQRLARGAHRAVLLAAAGQHADLLASRADQVCDPEHWLSIARAKSGALLAWAAWAGALVAGAPGSALDQYYAYGEHLGVLLQIADDFAGIWQPERAGDLATKRLSLPVCYALSVVPAEQQAALRSLLSHVVGQAATEQAAVRQQLIALGAQAYMLVTARIYQRHAWAALRQIGLSHDAMQPLRELTAHLFPELDYHL